MEMGGTGPFPTVQATPWSVVALGPCRRGPERARAGPGLAQGERPPLRAPTRPHTPLRDPTQMLKEGHSERH